MFKIAYFITFFLGFFPTDNDIIFQAIIAVIASGLLGLDVLNGKIAWRSLINIHTIFMFAWLVWALISGFWTIAFTDWFVQCLVIFVAFFHTVSLTYLFKQDGFKSELGMTFVLINVVHNIIGWYEYIFGNYHFALQDHFPSYHVVQEIPLSHFFNENTFALYMLMALIFIVYWRPPATNKINRYLKWGLVLSNVLMILILGSRGINILLMVTAFIIGFLEIKKWQRWPVYFLICGLILGVYVYYISQTGELSEMQTDGSLQIRINLIINSILITGRKLLIGVGPGSMPVYMGQSDLLYVAQYTVLHNWWAGLLVSHGLIFFIWYVARYIKKVFIAAKLSILEHVQAAKWIITTLLVMSVGVAIPDSLFHDSWFWTMMVMVNMYLYTINDQTEENV